MIDRSCDIDFMRTLNRRLVRKNRRQDKEISSQQAFINKLVEVVKHYSNLPTSNTSYIVRGVFTDKPAREIQQSEEWKLYVKEK